MSLRVGIDLDGTLADLSAAYHRIERTIFGDQAAAAAAAGTAGTAGTDADETSAAPDDDDAADPGDPRAPQVAKGDPKGDKERMRAAKAASQRTDLVWRAIRAEENFWTTLNPIEPGVVRRLHLTAIERRWEVFFVTQRPRTAGDSVQRQSQRWLIEHGFEAPSVLTLSGSRGRAAAALEWGFLIDDLPKNCVDVVSDSTCRPILVLREPNPSLEQSVSRMSIVVARSVAEALDHLEKPESAHRPSTVRHIMKKLGLA